ncbi:sugar transferase [Flavobacteriaceae bacterium]|nr:sugar transferase [Flavobacteriaceae bacterium]
MLLTMSDSYFIDSQNDKVLSYYHSNEAKSINDLLLSELDGRAEVIDFIQKHANVCLDTTYVTSTSEKFNIQKLESVQYASILNLKKINDIRFINKFFEAVNTVLPNSGLYFGKVITYPNRRKAIFNKYPPIINRIIYLTDYIFTRVLPKLKLTKKFYFYLTKGKSRVISRAETYGRLYACGFEIIDDTTIKNSLYFVAKKIKEPTYDKDPSYGPLIRLKRIGKNGKNIRVFKFRTMHPFSEYLQEFVYNKNKLQKGGKIKNDFRVSPEGRILRKFWIDELPMLLNILKGDIKLVGVRPLSAHFFSLYDSDLQKLRTQTKPGFIPPFYVDLPETMDEIMESERKYLMAYQKSPLITDIKYFFKSFQNVLFRGARSN